MSLSLRQDLHYCIANERVVLLDLIKDRYFGLPGPLDAAFQALAGGVATSEIPAATIDKLLDLGVLVNQMSATPWPKPPSLLLPTNSSIDTPPPVSLNLFAVADAYFLQRRQIAHADSLKLPAVVEEIRAQRDQRKIGCRSKPSAGTLRALRAYLATRWLVATHDQCLLQSATLYRFLVQRGWCPSFVVAVRMSPFAAHAWLQADDTVLNDRLDHVLPYTPILVL